MPDTGDTMPLVTVESDSKKAWVSTKIDPFMFNLLAKMPGRKKYIKGIPFIELDRANLEFLDSSLENVRFSGPAQKMVEGYRLLREMEKRAREDRHVETFDFADFPYKRQPYDHQRKAQALSRGKKAFGYFMEQGTGKTKVILDDAADLYLNGGSQGKIDTLIIIAPNGVHAQWVNEQIPEHLCDLVDRAAAYTSPAPTPEERLSMSEALKFRQGLRIFALHIDSLSHAKGFEFLRQLLLSGNCMLVVDESSRIKSSDSKRTKNIIALAKLAKYRRIATGTPVSQGAEDLYSQFMFLDPDILGYGSFYAFRNHFCRLGGFQNKKIVGYTNQQELMDKIDSHTFRVLKDDCLDLPERNFIEVQVPMHTEQRRVYDQIRKEFFLELESGIILTAKMAMQRIVRLQQIVNGFIWKNAKKDKHTGQIVEPFLYQEFPQNRVDAAMEIIRASAPDTKVIVWIKFQGDFKLMSEALNKEKLGWVSYVGATPSDECAPNIEKFRSDPDCKVFLATPAKGGIGLNLTVASEVIWYSRDFSLERELQANDRVHRIGQHRVVNYHFLVSPRTVDEKIAKILKAKQDVAYELIDLRDMFA